MAFAIFNYTHSLPLMLPALSVLIIRHSLSSPVKEFFSVPVTDSVADSDPGLHTLQGDSPLLSASDKVTAFAFLAYLHFSV